MEERWLSIVEYARTFQVSDMTVRRRIKTGKIPHTLRNGKYFIPVVLDQNGEPMSTNGASHKASKVRKSNNNSSRNHTPIDQESFYPEHTNSNSMSAQNTHRLQRDVVQNRPIQRSHLNSQNNDNQQNDLNFYAQQEYVQRQTVQPVVKSPREQRDKANYVKSNELGEVPVELQRMLNVCDRVLNELQQSNHIIKQNSEAKVSILQKDLAIKEAQITKLNQQLEDLQVLVKILESKYK